MNYVYAMLWYDCIGFFCMLCLFRYAAAKQTRLTYRLNLRDYLVAFMFSWAGPPIVLIALVLLAHERYKAWKMVREVARKLP